MADPNADSAPEMNYICFVTQTNTPDPACLDYKGLCWYGCVKRVHIDSSGVDRGGI